MNKPNDERIEKIKSLEISLYDLILEHQPLHSYEVAHRLIADGVSMILSTVPNNDYILASKTIIKCLETGIEEFKEFHKKEEK